MTLFQAIAWLAFAPALLVTLGNFWIQIHNLRGKRFISSIMVVPSILMADRDRRVFIRAMGIAATSHLPLLRS